MPYQAYYESLYNDWQQIDVVVSRDCTLRCEYCYLHKHKDNRYYREQILESFDKLLDYVHNNEDYKREGVVIGFYPEPWIDIKKSNDLIKDCLKILTKYPDFHENFMVMLGTNGVRLDQPIPILKHIMEHLAINVTIDGIKEQHDLYRVFKDGSGSWDKVVNNVKKYQDLYNIYNTKVTIGPETIKYIYDSTMYLWYDLNIIDLNMNVVFEDLWGTRQEKVELLKLYDQQLEKLTRHIIDNKVWNIPKYQSILGSNHIPQYNLHPNQNFTRFSPKAYCGAAIMRSIDVDGGIYPCFRLSPYSLNEPSPFRMDKSLTDESSRALNMFNAYDAAPKKCLECPIMSSCSMCVGGAWEEKKSIFWRTTHHCEFQKIQYKWAVELNNAIARDKGDEEIKNVL